jgi:hypothetical protein
MEHRNNQWPELKRANSAASVCSYEKITDSFSNASWNSGGFPGWRH